MVIGMTELLHSHYKLLQINAVTHSKGFLLFTYRVLKVYSLNYN